MAQSYAAHFTGIDQANVFPSGHGLPNLQFQQVNVLLGLKWRKKCFDFVFQRWLQSSFPSIQFEKVVIPELVRITKKGGYLEFCENHEEVFTGGLAARRMNDSSMFFDVSVANVRRIRLNYIICSEYLLTDTGIRIAT